MILVGIIVIAVILLLPFGLFVWVALGAKQSMNRNDRGRK